VVALVLAVAAAGCGSSGSGSDRSGGGGDRPKTDVATAASTDSRLTRDDVDCDAEALGDDASTQFIDAYYVVDGELGAVCFGDADPTMVKAWDSLAAITPPDQLNDLALFAGFGTAGGKDEEASGTTMAFVNVIDDEATAFQMSVNLDAYDDDPEQAVLTMAHEFSHVFTALPSQLDRSPDAQDDCPTYWNGEGCYLPDSLMAAWIARFWTPAELAKVDPDKDVGIDDGTELCAANAGFLGPYAATNPEEDFAETFSAFVYGVPAPTPEVQEKLDWMAEQPGLAEFRDRAEKAGLGPLDGAFEPCGR
jgi:hypothetical protein